MKIASRFIATLVVALGLSTAAYAGGMKKDIVDTAVSAGSFNTLATALTEAGP